MKKLEIVRLLSSDFRGPNPSYQLFEANFQMQIFPKLKFLFWSQDTPWFKNMRKIGLNFLYVFFS